jgi:hypothetical protein
MQQIKKMLVGIGIALSLVACGSNRDLLERIEAQDKKIGAFEAQQAAKDTELRNLRSKLVHTPVTATTAPAAKAASTPKAAPSSVATVAKTPPAPAAAPAATASAKPTPMVAATPAVYYPPMASVMFNASPLRFVGHVVHSLMINPGDPNNRALDFCAPRCLIIRNQSALPVRIIIGNTPIQLLMEPDSIPVPSVPGRRNINDPGWTVVIQMNDGQAPQVRAEYGDPDAYMMVTHPTPHSCWIEPLSFPFLRPDGTFAPHGALKQCY